ncbi:MAG TPA: 2-phospho-L-lactate transferase [Solirubrobacteraceae bacterium]
MSGPVVVLAGGTGGAKLARGMLDVVGADDLVVVANTGDDAEIYGGYVSPDPDLITFWLADRIDERGWGLAGDTFSVMDGLRELGVEIWFNLGDRDLAVAIERASALGRGLRLTEAQLGIGQALGVQARVLPMSDRPVRTRVMAGGRWWQFQEFMIKGGQQVPVEAVDYRGAAASAPSPEVRQAIEHASAIVIGPSNPVISIGPILAVPGIRESLASAPAPVVAVSPLVAGAVVKGPTEPFLRWAGQPLSSSGIAALYQGVIDGLVADQETDVVPVHLTDVLLADAGSRRRVAEETLSFAMSLGR